jgi:hypothetical protein
MKARLSLCTHALSSSIEALGVQALPKRPVLAYFARECGDPAGKCAR